MRHRAASLLLLSFMAVAFAVRADDAAPTVMARLSASDAVENMLFGRHLFIDGNTIVVSAEGSLATGVRQPATFIFSVDAEGQWVQHQELPVGGALSLQNGVLLVGDAVYTRDDAAAFVLRARLRPTDAQTEAEFGHAVALFDQGRRAAVGAPFATVDGVASAGAVYIFDRSSAGRWTQTARLTAPSPSKSRNFGMALAADGNTLLIGAPIAAGDGAAAAYVFVDGTNGWARQATFSGANGMGWSVALDGNVALVGSDGGAAYVFASNQGRWSRQATLKPPSGLSGEFGFDVALAGRRALVGFPPRQISTFSGGATAPEPGRVLLYLRNVDGSWSETAALGPYEESENLGISVAMDNGTLLIADPQADADSYEAGGIVYVLAIPTQPVVFNDDGGGGAFAPVMLGLFAAAVIPLVRARRMH